MARSDGAPLWTARVVSLFMAWAWAIIAFAAAISADVKSDHDKAKVRALAPKGTQVDINDKDIFSTGAVITAASITIFVVTSISLFIIFFRPTTRPRTNTIQGGLLAFCAVFLFATLVPYTHFFRTRSAVVHATLGGVPVPQSIIDALQKQNHISPVYNTLSYLRLVAILPWFTLLFTIIASIVLLMAASRARAHTPTAVEGTHHGTTNRTSEAMEEKEKPGVEHA